MKIAIIDPPKTHYGAIYYDTRKWHDAFKSNGVEVKLFSGELVNHPNQLKKDILSYAPDYTFSVNGLLPDSYGNFFCDVVQIPHIAFLIDSPARFLPLFKSKNTIITCLDKNHVDFVKGYGKKEVYFVPMGMDQSLKYSDNPRPYDVTMLYSCIDYLSILESWLQKYSKKAVSALKQAATITLSDTKTSYIQALKQSMIINQINPLDIDYPIVLNELDYYIRGYERVAIVNTIQGATVHLFGDSLGTNTWNDYITNPRVVFHGSVPVTEALEVMEQSKIVINAFSPFKEAIHTRVFMAFGKGALPLTCDNTMTHGCFKDGKEIALFQMSHLNQINETVKKYLDNEKLRKDVTEKGRAKAVAQHSWDKRCHQLLKSIS